MKTPYSERDYTFGQAMFTLRSKIGITQEQMGKIVGVSGRAVSEWETGNSYPKAERLKAFIALVIQYQAFAKGSEASEIRALWQSAHQRMLLDEDWLCALLSGLPSPQGQRDEELPSYPAPPHGVGPAEEAMGSVAAVENQPLGAGIIDNHSPWSIIKAGSTPNSLPPAPNKMRKRSKWLLAILITLVILTIIGSIGGTLFFHARGPASKTAIAGYPGYLSGKGTRVFFDPLNQADGSEWASHSIDSGGGSCQFTGGAYHVSQQQSGIFKSCPAFGIFTNFAFEVQLVIVQGDCSGIVFRDDGHGNFYYFEICQNGRYEVIKYVHDSGTDTRELAEGSSGLSPHKMAVVANSSSMTFYVNEQQINQAQDSSYTSGYVTLTAGPYSSGGGHATDVAYSNAMLWRL